MTVNRTSFDMSKSSWTFGPLALVLCIACSGGSQAPSGSGASPQSPPASPSTAAQPDACARVRAIVRTDCTPQVSAIAERCTVSNEPRVGIGVEVGTPDTRGPGVFVNFAGSPEWFLKDDGTLLTVNGTARGACKGLTNIIEYIGSRERELAPKRGDSPKTYEGVYDKAGNFLFDTCSQYEIEVAAIYNRELFRDPNEPESKSTKRAAKKVGLPLKLASDIYMKTMMQCQRAVNTHPLAGE